MSSQWCFWKSGRNGGLFDKNIANSAKCQILWYYCLSKKYEHNGVTDKSNYYIKFSETID